MSENAEKAAFICSRDTLDGVYPSLLLGINSRRLGMEAKIFFTFMGLNVIRKGSLDKVKFYPPGVMGAIPGMSQMATRMMKKKIENAQVPDLEDMREMAQLEGVQFIACLMTVDMMELKEDDFIEGVVIWTAEEFLKYAKDCTISLFT
ncbi:MAG: DsrE/DsrF/DrsH-like family protein [Desulfobacteraceae bacterium]|nr:DsrE/DsrF/DrsH-like family protein [Desulfobacteraceae bacterium]